MDYSRFYRPLIQFFVYTYSLNTFTYAYVDPDLYGHITFGREIWEQGRVPEIDTYSYTAYGHEWINHEWLMEVFMFLLYDVWGSPGLLLVRVLLGLSIIHILSQLYFAKANNLFAYALYFICLAHALGLGFAMRPQLITYLFIPMMMYILHQYFDGNKRGLFLLPVIFLIWVNSHGGVVAGIGIFGVIVGVEAVRGLLYKTQTWKPLAVTWAVSAAMLFINPAGYHLLAFFAETIPYRRDITEWFPVTVFDDSHLFFKALVVLFFISLFSKKPKHAWEVLIIAAAIVYGFKHVRHTVLTSLLMTPFVPIHLAAVIERFQQGKTPRHLPRLVHVVVAWFLIGFAAFQINYQWFRWSGNEFQIQVKKFYYPVYEMRFLKENNLNGNILTLMNWGEYLIWHLPDSRVSVDGRYWTVYSPKLLRQNMIFHNGWEGWQHFLKFYRHDIILTHFNNMDLENLEGWVKIFQGPRARIFVRTSKPYHPAYLKYRQKQFRFNNEPPSWHFP
ncbi:hypothetical protein [Nitrospina watsonii]|uniref:Glycosyltransferase RgtA/B/C/D-like domain-containing protein n=1 Tax=Nitrospina watsonii TaxID=1323948 RepID=A0ABN8W604_9BACT|nr:hypothetical protein [Nitrospina watsonii]CAI2719518.1 conserved membrane protein of unknown function [Nitrospina watsonii]